MEEELAVHQLQHTPGKKISNGCSERVFTERKVRGTYRDEAGHLKKLKLGTVVDAKNVQLTTCDEHATENKLHRERRAFANVSGVLEHGGSSHTTSKARYFLREKLDVSHHVLLL